MGPTPLPSRLPPSEHTFFSAAALVMSDNTSRICWQRRVFTGVYFHHYRCFHIHSAASVLTESSLVCSLEYFICHKISMTSEVFIIWTDCKIVNVKRGRPRASEWKLGKGMRSALTRPVPEVSAGDSNSQFTCWNNFRMNNQDTIGLPSVQGKSLLSRGNRPLGPYSFPNCEAG